MARITLNDDDRLLDELIRIYLRPCVWVADGSADPAPVFTPSLSAAEQTTLATLRKLARRGGLVITPDERTAVEPFLVTGRAFTALSQAEFIALTQNARDRMLFDNVTALWRVIFRVLRDG